MNTTILNIEIQLTEAEVIFIKEKFNSEEETTTISENDYDTVSSLLTRGILTTSPETPGEIVVTEIGNIIISKL